MLRFVYLAAVGLTFVTFAGPIHEQLVNYRCLAQRNANMVSHLDHFDVAVGNRIAQATAENLLRHVRIAIETEFLADEARKAARRT